MTYITASMLLVLVLFPLAHPLKKPNNLFTVRVTDHRLWSLHAWRHPKPDWTWSWATNCRWPSLLEQGVALDDLQRFLPTSAILWFCEFLCLYAYIGDKRLIFSFSLEEKAHRGTCGPRGDPGKQPA